jgi:hypothetical protein
MRHLNKLIPVIFAWVCLFSINAAQAETMNIEVNTGAVISDPGASGTRILLKFDMPQELSNQEIIFAELHFQATCTIPDSSSLMIDCAPLILPWTGENATWDNFGGDLTNGIISGNSTYSGVLNAGLQDIYLDITDFMRSWQDSSLTNNGLITYPESEQESSFSYSQNEGQPFATIRIEFEPISQQ